MAKAEEKTIEMTIEGRLDAYDAGFFNMPIGATIDTVNGKWGSYIVTFTDPKKYPDIKVQCDHSSEGKHPNNVIVWDSNGKEYYDENCQY